MLFSGPGHRACRLSLRSHFAVWLSQRQEGKGLYTTFCAGNFLFSLSPSDSILLYFTEQNVNKTHRFFTTPHSKNIRPPFPIFTVPGFVCSLLWEASELRLKWTVGLKSAMEVWGVSLSRQWLYLCERRIRGFALLLGEENNNDSGRNHFDTSMALLCFNVGCGSDSPEWQQNTLRTKDL